MNRIEKLQYLNQSLWGEMPEYHAQAAQFSQEDAAQRRLLRSLMNVPDKGLQSSGPVCTPHRRFHYLRAGDKAGP